MNDHFLIINTVNENRNIRLQLYLEERYIILRKIILKQVTRVKLIKLTNIGRKIVIFKFFCLNTCIGRYRYMHFTV